MSNGRLSSGGGRHGNGTNTEALRPDQTDSYERKSTIKKDGTTKSLEDQRAVNLETAEEYGLPLLPENQMSEAPGYKGTDWWVGGGGTGLAGDDRTGARFRPVLTKIMERVEKGQLKCLVVYSLDRLWRDVALCKMMIDTLGKHGCALYDRSGYVDILTPEGRANVLQQAVRAMEYRELCAVLSPRGCRSTRNKGKTVVTANVLGYRHVGKGQVKVVMEEILLVRRIFVMYLAGTSLTEICRILMSEGIVLAPDLYAVRSVKRNEATHDIVYPKQIRAVLSDPRYQGKQPHEGAEWECKDFLVDGEPAVEPAIYEEAQRRLNSRRRIGNAARSDNYLAGLVKCGYCGQYMCLNPEKHQEGSIKRFWQTKTKDVQSWCTHSLPNVTEAAMCTYVTTTLMPWLMAQLDETQATLDGSAGANEAVRLRQEIAAEQVTFKARVKKLYANAEAEGKDPAQALLTLQEMHDEAVACRETRLASLEAAAVRDRELVGLRDRTASSLERWAELGDDQKKAVIQSLIKWVVILPSEDFASREKRRGGSRSTDRKIGGAPPAGRVVFLSEWNALHTAVIKRVDNPDSATWHRPLGMVPAEINECLGSCAELPDPAAFAAGLKRSYDGRGYRYHPSEVMPGYLTKFEPPTFGVD